MTVHLLKMAVGIDSVEHLGEVQRQRVRERAAEGQPAVLRHLTRHRPKRADEIVDGGSIYWIVKGSIRARQRILGFEDALNWQGEKRCGIVLDPDIVATALRPHRPMQGWRYFDPDSAPPDVKAAGRRSADEMPAEMEAALRELGLL